MKNVFFKCLLVVFLTGTFFSCEENESDELTREQIEKELERIKAILEANTQITSVSYVGDQMVLTFANGQTLSTDIPSNVIPQIGSNGNWWINGQDLGVSAEGKAPTVGANGNWWVGTEDTGVKAKGAQGEKGEDGKGIANITYDPETAILTITLTDGTKFPFVIGATGDGNVGGNLIGDLNGEFVLTSITNGDLPFATLSYDANYNLTNVDYYTNVLNSPERLAGLTQTYANGKVATHRLVQYAEVEKVLPVTNVFINRDNNIHEKFFSQYAANQLFDEMFPHGIPNFDGNKDNFISLLFHRFSRRPLYTTEYVYVFNEKYLDNYYIYRYPRSLYTEDSPFEKKYVLVKDGNDVYFYLPYDSYNHYVNNIGNNDKPSIWVGHDFCLDLSQIQIYKYGEEDLEYDISINEGLSMINICDITYFRVKAEPYTGKADIIEGKKLYNYFAPKSDEIIYLDNLSGNYKSLYCEYMMYDKGDEIQGVEVNYAYSANDIKVNFDGQTYANVTLENNKLKKVIVVDEDGDQTEVLSFNYTGDLLTTIDAPFAKATDVAKLSYDKEGNLLEMSVNSSKLKGQGMEDILYTLGLITTYTYYDADLGRVVYGYKYSDDYAPLVRISYNYGYKNFMNHTLVAANPIISLFKFQNAIEEINWAGHGSCFLAEYSNFNEGGYPQRIKGILQYSPTGDSDLTSNGSAEYPVNGSVATLYKLSYEKKQQ